VPYGCASIAGFGRVVGVSIRYPAPLRPGDRIAVTSPSCGVGPQMRPRLDFCLTHLRDLGYDVVVGDCMDGSGITSAPAPTRAAELTAMLVDPAIRAVVPPWGGELAIDLLPLLDLEAISAAQPTWLVGYSDLTTVMVPLTLRTGIATLHGSNLMDTPYAVPEPLLPWLAAATAPAGSELRQGAAAAYRSGRHDHYAFHPDVREMTLNTPGQWKLLGPQDGAAEVCATGRMIGGCLETVSMLPGSPYGDVADFAARHAREGLLVYVEVAEADAVTVARMLHHLRLAGWFDRANAVLVGRSAGPSAGDFSQHDALVHALGDLLVPVLYDVDLGHIPPQLTIVNGALATVELTPTTATLVQRLI
jgi:muramoyltetrapeptide carboxypeptidase LdcA involved in peptidoglycan recycling